MPNASLANPNLSIDAVHDGRHALADKPHSRESIPYIIVLPEHQIALFTYTWVNKNSEAGAAVAVFGPGAGDKPFLQKLADRPVPRDMNFDNWTIEGFRMEQDLKFGKARVRWETPEAMVDFTYESNHAPYAYASDPRGCPVFCADDRIEQAGNVKGTLKIGGRTIEFEGTGHRDHSWGNRDWMAMQQYEWFVGQCGDSISVHFWRLQALGKTHVRGYVHKDGKMALVERVDIDVTYDAQYWQQGYVAKILDGAGRETSLSVDVFARETLAPDPCITLRESGGAAIIDGKPGVGWLECGWSTPYLQHITKPA